MLVRVVRAVKLFVSLDRILLCARRQQVLRLWVAEEDDAERSCLEVTDDLFAPICSQRASLCRSRPHLCTHPSDNLALDVLLAHVEPRLDLGIFVVAFSDLEGPLAVHRRAAVDQEERRRLLPLFVVGPEGSPASVRFRWSRRRGCTYDRHDHSRPLPSGGPRQVNGWTAKTRRGFGGGTSRCQNPKASRTQRDTP